MEKDSFRPFMCCQFITSFLSLTSTLEHREGLQCAGKQQREQKCGQKNGSKRSISHKVQLFSDAAAIFQLLLFPANERKS
jgi:hypothetical protein